MARADWDYRSVTTTREPMPKCVEQRQQYVDHVRKIFTLAGETDAQAAKDADTVMTIETRLAKASLTITEMRDPQNLNHPD